MARQPGLFETATPAHPANVRARPTPAASPAENPVAAPSPELVRMADALRTLRNEGATLNYGALVALGWKPDTVHKLWPAAMTLSEREPEPEPEPQAAPDPEPTADPAP